MNINDIKWSQGDYDGYNRRYELVGHYNGFRFSSTHYINFIAIWMARKSIEWKFKALFRNDRKY